MENNQQNNTQPAGQPAAPVKRSRFHVTTDPKDAVFAGIFLVFSVAAVWLCFWGGLRSGVTIANWAFIILVTCYCYKSGGGSSNKAFPIFCAASSVIMSTIFSIHADGMINLLILLGVIALDCIYFDGMWGRDRYGSTDIRIVFDILNRLIKQTLTKLLVPFTSIYGKNGQGKSKKGGKIALGVIIAIPVVIALTSLLKSDAAFSGLMDNILVDTGDLVWICILGVIFFPFIMSFVFSIRKNLDSGITYINKDSHVLDSTVVNTVLCAVGALYTVYLVSQLSYFFGAFSGLLPEKFTYAEYARRGFFELCAISTINLGIVFISGALTKRSESSKRSVLNKVLSTFICFVTLIIIASVEAKIYMYVKEYGMTRKRLLPAIFMIMLAVCFIAAVIRVFKEDFPYIKLLVCAAVIILSVTGFSDIDTIIAKYNISAHESGKLENFSLYDLNELGAGSTPEISKLLTDKNGEVRAAAKYLLKSNVYKYYYTDYQKKTYEETHDILGINSFTFDEYREYKVIKENIDKLNIYEQRDYYSPISTDFYSDTYLIMSYCTNSDVLTFSQVFFDFTQDCTSIKFDADNDEVEVGYYRLLFFKGNENYGWMDLRRGTVKLEGCENGFRPDTVFDVTKRSDDYLVLTARSK